MDKKQSKLVADAIGRKLLAECLGVGVTAVSNAVSRGWFPATWSNVVILLAEWKGVDCPSRLFRMLPLDKAQIVVSACDCQPKSNNHREAAQ